MAAAAVAAVAVLLLLAVAPTSTLAQVEGDACGPSHSGGDMQGKWIRIPASKLIATGPTGPITADSSGCVTSDTGYAANVHVYLSAGTWNVYNVTAKLRAAKSNAVMSILVGDADVPTVMKTLRSAGGANKLATVLKHFTTCATRRMSALASATPSTQTFDCDLSKTDSSGQHFGFVAPGERIFLCPCKNTRNSRALAEHG